VCAAAGLAVALAGFTPTFFLPSLRGEFRAPPIVWVHGALAFGWILMFVAQTQWIRRRAIRMHRRIGYGTAGIALGLVATGVPVGLWATGRDLAAGLGDVARGQFVNILVELAVFGALVGAAVWLRRDPDWHKRLMLLATLSVLGPAWFRLRHWFPSVPNPLVTFSLLADSIVLVVVAHEYAQRRRLHPAYWAVAPAVVAVHLAELFLSQTRPWLSVARTLLGEPVGS
jgi:uncharacterized membrane protein YozB (DUF420 family)